MRNIQRCEIDEFFYSTKSALHLHKNCDENIRRKKVGGLAISRPKHTKQLPFPVFAMSCSDEEAIRIKNNAVRILKKRGLLK